MSDHDPKTHALRAYGDLRLLFAEWVSAPDAETEHTITATIDLWLRTHCCHCGAPVPFALRKNKSFNAYCWPCQLEGYNLA